MNVYIYVCMDGWIGGWMDEWVDGCMYVWKDEWMDGQINT